MIIGETNDLIIYDIKLYFLVFYRRNRVKTVEVPGTSRHVRTYPTGGNDMVILADRLSDCLVIQKQDIDLCTLAVFVNRVLKQETDGISAHGQTDAWQEIIVHLLETFHPEVINIHVTRTESGIQENGFHICLQDGLYWCGWSGCHTTLTITR